METLSDAAPALWWPWVLAAAGALLLLIGLSFLWKRKQQARRQKQLALQQQAELSASHTAPAALPQLEKRTTEEPLSQAELLRAERQHLEAQAQKLKEKEAREALEAQAKALKAQEEEAKRLAYRQKKEAEAEAKAEKLRQEAAEAQQREEEARVERQRQEEEERARVAQEAGKTLAEGLSKTRKEGFLAKLGGLFGGAPRSVDAALLGELEELLFSADIGVHTASRLLASIEGKAKKQALADLEAVRTLLKAEMADILNLPPPPPSPGEGPEVWMVVGVNGSGKTTSIGKLAAQAKAQGKKVVLAAADTFRAAAAEQLDIWAERSEALLIKGKEEADPAAVAFEGVKRAKEEGAHLVIIDTAGRLHTKQPLMEELKKIHRVLGKAQAGAPHQVLLVLDATMGQNAITQAKQFSQAVAVTQIILSKLDGTAKGGVVIGICDELKLPVGFIGIGERAQDLRPFVPAEFVEALFEES
ncbi:MAG: signal recognition particle-docking protein FtsY [Cystobacterineae bacterium]|nr:signal recognition particle-docking protein FtsY [Cystobacterineae bacterium]